MPVCWAALRSAVSCARVRQRRPGGRGGAAGATGAAQTNPGRAASAAEKPLLFMFPHLGSDVKGFSFSSACAINFKRLLWEECGSDLGRLR